MMCSLCKELDCTEHAMLLKTWLPSYMESLCQLAGHCPEDVVFIVVDSLQLVARVGCCCVEEHCLAVPCISRWMSL